MTSQRLGCNGWLLHLFAMVLCTGCNREFSTSGFTSHVILTRTAVCRAAYRKLSIPSNYVGDDDVDMESTGSENFEGDLYGQYEQADFDWPDGDETIIDRVEEQEEETEEEDDLDANDPGIELELQDPQNTTNEEPSNALGVHPSSQSAEYPAKDYVVEYFPGDKAGAPLECTIADQSNFEKYQQQLNNNAEYAPFVSQIDWEIARWAKTHGQTSTAVTELLQIDGVVDKLGLSYKNVRELNKIIDQRMPNQRHYQLSGEQQSRVFHDMHTGSWWWEIQTVLEARKPGASVIPLIISSDRTQVTLFGNKTAYPIYMTIGNLPKAIRCKPSRQGQILLAYLPTSKMRFMPNKTARRRMLINVFHTCLRRLLSPLVDAGIEGIAMSDGMGTIRRVHPILAVYVGDYPEQLLVTCVKNTQCPKCDIPPTELGNLQAPSSPRNVHAVREALAKVSRSLRDFQNACKRVGIKPIFHPFWEQLPFIDIFQAITPDILHQIHQGVFKHLISWLAQGYGTAEIDAHFQRVIPNHHIRVFSAGITSLSRVTGKEHNLMGAVILGVIADMGLLRGFNSARLLRAVRALLDFMYLARLPVITTCHLALMKKALETFHNNKQILIDMEIRENFNIPKLHSCSHYFTSIKLFGTTDNYDTQYTERLHIDFTKDAYRATNTRDEYPQMTQWLERHETILHHSKYIEWRRCGSSADLPTHTQYARLAPHRFIKMTKHPSIQSVPVEHLVSKYGATFFHGAFARFVVLWRNPQTTRARLEQDIQDVHFPFIKVSVYHRIRFQDKHLNMLTVDSIHIQPPRKDNRGRPIAGRFDTCLVHCGEGRTGIHAYRIAQIRTIFSIGSVAVKYLFGDDHPPEQHLAYVEWFTPFQPNPEPNIGLYKVSRSMQDGARIASVVPVTRIVQSIHLSPLPGRNIPLDWASDSVLEECRNFLVNSFADRHTYLLFHGPT